MPRKTPLLIGMFREAHPWERAYMALLVALAIATVFQQPLHIPRILGSIMVFVMVVAIAGSFFVIDIVRSRLD